jgi:hypothetical protein
VAGAKGGTELRLVERGKHAVGELVRRRGGPRAGFRVAGSIRDADQPRVGFPCEGCKPGLCGKADGLLEQGTPRGTVAGAEVDEALVAAARRGRNDDRCQRGMRRLIPTSGWGA